MVMLASNSLIL